FPMFDSDANNYAVATHVENEYAQALEETGAVGVAMLLLFVAIIGSKWWNAAAPRKDGGVDAGLAVFGLGYGLIAVIVHSFTDFGQHLPANACLTAATCGLIVALARMHPIPNLKSQIPNP